MKTLVASLSPFVLPTSAHPFIRFVAVSLLAAATLSAQASDRADHDLARQALAAGQILPLRTVMERLEREQPGQVLEVELERSDGRWIYEFKVLQVGGRLVKLKVDARTGETVSRRDRRGSDLPAQADAPKPIKAP